MEDIATLNGDIPSDYHDTGNATTISSEHSISDLNSDHGVEQLSAVLHHLTETLAGRAPPQLLMYIPDSQEKVESKNRKLSRRSRRICTTKESVTCTYTGIAASIIDGETLHVIAQVPVNGREQSQKTGRKLAVFWANKLYLIIDENSMISRKFFARISAYMAKGKSLAGGKDTNKSFGGVNVVLVGDSHQFPPGKMYRYCGHVICLKTV
ncbi:hypothetical protein AZE42_05140 [Rhizopogon vesiculosus]|uniref:ATP-dependent DNA helicase n=1 Tax=Rhizopogon vesiculosus TaxID=180088 RepID=A0A1J8PTD0_9AGAM|nr:hypothetical protein AZE42_05140 [Rhizopogon vesiculosus]